MINRLSRRWSAPPLPRLFCYVCNIEPWARTWIPARRSLTGGCWSRCRRRGHRRVCGFGVAQAALELELERSRGRASYAEVEESEADLARFQSWLGKNRGAGLFQRTGPGAGAGDDGSLRGGVGRVETEALAAESPGAMAASSLPGAEDIDGRLGQEPAGRSGGLRAVD